MAGGKRGESNQARERGVADLGLPYSVVKREEFLVLQQFLAEAGAVTCSRATEEDLQLPARIEELKQLAWQGNRSTSGGGNPEPSPAKGHE